MELIRSPGIVFLILDVAGCTSGFVDLERLVGQFVTSDLLNNFQYLYPDIKFTCNGSIKRWSVLVRRPNGGSNRVLYPELQIWRKESEGVCTKVGNTTLSDNSTNEDNINEHKPDSPLEFQAEDIFGIFQPPTDQSRLRVYTHRRVGNSPTALRISAAGVVDTLNLTELDNEMETRRVHVLISVSTGEYF